MLPAAQRVRSLDCKQVHVDVLRHHLRADIVTADPTTNPTANPTVHPTAQPDGQPYQ